MKNKIQKLIMQQRDFFIIGVALMLMLAIGSGVAYFSGQYSQLGQVQTSVLPVTQYVNCFIDWSKAYGNNPSNINPDLRAALCRLGQQTGTQIIPNAGYRTAAEQQALGDELIAANPGYYRNSDGTVRNAQGQLVAETPQNSWHVTGNAVDINRNGVAGEFYTEEELERAGLTGSGFETKVRNEPWHVVLK
ncbi:hypothetical protein FWF48_01220 [Candidatus Saccharibacteria bacterium]|nr:hypothetical protein [Candidatus Saccharibacteria bacterium]